MRRLARGLGPALLAVCAACSSPSPPGRGPIRVLLDRAPTTLNPRMALDSNGQRLGELIYAALTLKDENMRPKPALAESWSVSKDGRTWEFRLREGLKDHGGQDITPERIVSCLEEYRTGKPVSPLITGFPGWRSTEAIGRDIILRLGHPDPYLATNLTLLRYFTTGDPSKPCREPLPGQEIVTSGAYRPRRFRFEDLTPEEGFELVPMDGAREDPSRRPFFFSWALDQGTMALKLVHGDVDVAMNTLSLTKTRWIERAYADRFRVIERGNGVNVSYLQFNLRHPALRRLAVRRAIAMAIDRQGYVRDKLLGFGRVAGSLLSPEVDGSSEAFPYDPRASERLLDEAGYPRGPDGVRLRFRFKTTSVRDGLDTAMVLQQMLEPIGIHLTLEIVEPAVFFASIRKGAFELYSSRWVGVSDASIFERVLRSSSPDNRGAYLDPAMDALLDRLSVELDPARRGEILREIQAKAATDLPFFPLWYWNTSAILARSLQGLSADELSLSASLVPLSHLR